MSTRFDGKMVTLFRFLFRASFYFRTWVDADKVDAVCGESYQCKYDYSTTLNMEFALFTKYYQDQFINIREGVLKPESRGIFDPFLFIRFGELVIE